MPSNKNRLARIAVYALACATMAACGGGGGGDGSPSPSPSPPPPPPPAPATEMDLSVISATSGEDLPISVGHAFREGQVPQASAVLADIADFQCDVKNRWPDGSVKFAILSGRLDLSANQWKTIALSIGAAPAPQPALTTGDLAATGATASIQFGAFGTAGWSGSDWNTPARTWISGPQMSSWTYRKPLGSDAHLVAWLEVRLYKGGRIEVLPWIENGYLNVAGPAAKSGTATFTLGGTQRYAQSLALLNHQRAVLASGSTLTHWVGGDPQVTPRHSTAYLMATRLVPNYRGATATGSPLLAGLPASYTPLAQASYPTGMGSPGYDPSIGLLPEWDVAYLTSGGDARAWRSVMINGYAAGRYGIHYRDETTHRPLSFSSYPDLVMGSGSGVSSIGASSTNTYTPAASGASPPTYSSSHHPSMGYMAYLLSGRHYYLEEAQFLATANFLKQNNTTRQGQQGVFESSAGANTTRGAAWALRSLAQAAAVTPDGDPLRAQFVNSLNENIAYYHGRYVAAAHNPLGLVQPYEDYEPGNGAHQAAAWMDDFFTATVGYIKDLQAHADTHQARLDAFAQWKYRSVVGRLGGTSSAALAYPHAAQYTFNYAPSESADWSSGAGPWYANWGDVARSMSLPTTAAAGAALASGYPTEPTAYWGNLMPAIAYAVDHGASGASAAWDRMISASNFTTLVSGFDDRPVWGVRPRTR